MTGIDAMGFLAAGLVLCAACMKRLVPLRVMAIASNLAFILYGYIVSLWPVLILHLILLPVNTVRLAEVLGADFLCAFSAVGRQHHLFKKIANSPPRQARQPSSQQQRNRGDPDQLARTATATRPKSS